MSSVRTLEILIALFGIYFMSGSLTTPLTPAGSDASFGVQAIGALLGLGAILTLAATPGAINRVIVLYWPVLLLPALAVLSLVWSVDPALSFRRAGSLILTTFFGFWLVERFQPSIILRLFIWASIFVILTSTYAIFYVPKSGIHQLYDIEGAQHAGSWRGLFYHKNDFGRAIALSASTLLIAVFFNSKLRWIALPLFAFCALLVLRSNSSQGLMLYISVPSALVALVVLMKLRPIGRGMLLIFMIPLLLAVYMSSRIIFESILFFLGKEATLTGRTDIWAGVLLALQEDMMFGGGFGAGWEVVGVRLFALTGIDVGHAHNGYLDLATDLGMFGLFLTIGFLFWMAYLCLAALMRRRLRGIALLGLAVFIFTIAGNWVGSFLLKHNSLYWLTPVVVFCLMRQVFNPYGRSARADEATAALPSPGEIPVFPQRPSANSDAGGDTGARPNES